MFPQEKESRIVMEKLWRGTLIKVLANFSNITTDKFKHTVICIGFRVSFLQERKQFMPIYKNRKHLGNKDDKCALHMEAGSRNNQKDRKKNSIFLKITSL